jgi:ribbon-helix-helix CopG family protein
LVVGKWKRPRPSAAFASGREKPSSPNLTYVSFYLTLTYMEKTQIYLRKDELDALRAAAKRSGRSMAELVRDAIRQVVLRPLSSGPVALWDGELKRTSIDHDTVHDEP